MSGSKSSALGIIALITGLAGMGLGGLSFLNLQVQILNGTFANNYYYCSSASEVQASINAIGSGSGEIVITQDITFNTTIDVDGGGSYIIRGLGVRTLTVLSDIHAFNISETTTCSLRDFIINASAMALDDVAAIYVDETDNNPVSIENIQILGDEGKGVGIEVHSYYVTIQNCYIKGIYRGIHIDGGHYSKILNNLITETDSDGIYLESGSYIVVEGNTLRFIDTGIHVATSYNVISNNIIRYIESKGISLSIGDHNTITGNTIYADNSVNSNEDLYGLVLRSDSNGNTITGNIINAINNVGSGVGYGMDIGSCDENVIIGNRLLYNQNNAIIISGGTGNIIQHNNEG